jgi:hypothetical protein
MPLRDRVTKTTTALLKFIKEPDKGSLAQIRISITGSRFEPDLDL